MASGDAGNSSWSPWVDGGRLVIAAHLAPLLGSMCGGSKGSLGSKIGEPSIAARIGGRRRVTTVVRVVGLGVLRVKI
jgi:hypothetical protein